MNLMQLYARVFTQILDSSIAEDFLARHVFEDLLKICDYRTGVVDVTREALSRRLNIPLDKLQEALTRLESPDPKSRDQTSEGRRILRLDEHRDWGWKITNWEKYEKIRSHVDGAMRVAKCRANKKIEKAEHPTLEDVKFYCAACQLPESDAVWFWNKCEGNGWTNDGKPIKSWTHTISAWKSAGYMPSQKASGNASNGKPPTIMDLKTILQLKEQKAQQLKAKHTSELAMGTTWDDEGAKKEFLQLRSEIKALQIRIEKMV